MDVELGQVLLRKYLVDRLVGRGILGPVYEARDYAIDRRVAIRIVLPDAQLDRALVEREAAASGKLDNRHVAEFLAVETLPAGSLCIVNPYFEGDTLHAKLQRLGRMSALGTTQLLAQLLRGLMAASQVGLAHRDLTPRSIFIVKGPDGGGDNATIIDFGLSRLESYRAEPSGHTQALNDSFQYLSPEQLNGLRELDRRSNFYSLGIIAYETITGGLPFEGRDFATLTSNILLEDPKPVEELAPSVPTELVQVIRKAMARSPNARFQSAEEMFAAVATIAEQLGGAPLEPLTAAPNVLGRDGAEPVSQERVALQSGAAVGGSSSATAQVEPSSATAQVEPSSAAAQVEPSRAVSAVDRGSSPYDASGIGLPPGDIEIAIDIASPDSAAAMSNEPAASREPAPAAAESAGAPPPVAIGVTETGPISRGALEYTPPPPSNPANPVEPALSSSSYRPRQSTQPGIHPVTDAPPVGGAPLQSAAANSPFAPVMSKAEAGPEASPLPPATAGSVTVTPTTPTSSTNAAVPAQSSPERSVAAAAAMAQLAPQPRLALDARAAPEVPQVALSRASRQAQIAARVPSTRPSPPVAVSPSDDVPDSELYGALPRRSRKTIVGAALLLGVAAIGALVLFASRNQEEPSASRAPDPTPSVHAGQAERAAASPETAVTAQLPSTASSPTAGSSSTTAPPTESGLGIGSGRPNQAKPQPPARTGSAASKSAAAVSSPRAATAPNPKAGSKKRDSNKDPYDYR